MSDQQRDIVCLVLPLSGPHAALGRRVAGLLEGELDRLGVEAERRRYDTRGSALGVGPAVELASLDGCTVMLGGLGDSESVHLADAAEQARVPLVALGEAPDGKARRWVVWARTPRDAPVRELADHLVRVRRVAAVSVLVPDNAYGRFVAAAFTAEATSQGASVEVQYLYPPGTTPDQATSAFAALWKDAVSSSGGCVPRALFMADVLARARRIAAFLRFKGVLEDGGDRADCPDVVLAGTATWHDRALLGRSGDELEGALFGDVVVKGDVSAFDAEIVDAARLAAAGLSARLGKGALDFLAAVESGLNFKGVEGDLRVEAGRVLGRRLDVFEIGIDGARPVSAFDTDE